ncbi:MAG TPA: FprA family A-type flavoprotein, partial [Muribaculaceae bacterium]|nr:FprA family A-type flavoprotein [Muribaculaceae bacterium]
MLQITPNVRFIGVEDDNLDLFEGQYPICKGISYNSYLILDEKIAIVDSVDIRRSCDWLAKLNYALDGRNPDFLIIQHVEPDHSGSIKALLDIYPGIKVVATTKAVSMLSNFFEGTDFNGSSIPVNDGDTLSLGQTALRFITAPMVHWPEVMMTLDETDGILFSADAFGSFATYSSTEAWDNEARRYYCNIVGKYGTSVQAVMKKLTGQPFSIIAPLHGPVLRDNLAHYWTLYDKWSRYEPETDGTLVAYASIYGGTAEAARHLAAMIEAMGSGETVLMDLCRHDVSYAVAEAFRLSRL